MYTVRRGNQAISRDINFKPYESLKVGEDDNWDEVNPKLPLSKWSTRRDWYKAEENDIEDEDIEEEGELYLLIIYIVHHVNEHQ